MRGVTYPIVFYSYYNRVGNPGSASGNNQMTVEKVKTWNASDNAPMQAVNTKLGFKREVGWITMEKNLA